MMGYLTNLSYDTLTNNSTGIYLSSPQNTPQVANNVINNNLVAGISLVNASPDIFHNNIVNNGSAGIVCNMNSAPEINYNNIINDDIGVYSANYSPSRLSTDYMFDGHNLIKNNSTAIFAEHHSNVTAMYNSIYSNTNYEVDATDTSDVYVQDNYWGTSNPNYFRAQNNSSVDWTNPLQNDPLGGGQNRPAVNNGKINDLSLVSETEEIENGVSSRPGKDSSLDSAFQLQIKGKFAEAIAIYDRIVKSELKTDRGIYSLIRMKECYSISRAKGFDSYLTNIIKQNAGLKDAYALILLELENQLHMNNRDYTALQSNLSKIITGYPGNSQSVKHALFTTGLVNFEYLGNAAKAKEAFTLLEERYPKDFLANISKLYIQQIDKFGLNKNSASGPEAETLIKKQIPTDYELSQNYPNPFNPTTTISYSVPVDSKVKLIIYDALGRMVKVLLDETKTAGHHSVVFNAEYLSSGVYFYSITARSEGGSRKDFQSNMKMLLIK